MNRKMKIGETYTWSTTDGKGNINRTYTLTRTARDYVYDLADAYNAVS